MRLFDVPMIENHSYMMYLKNVTTPDRLLDLNWIFTKIKNLPFLKIFLPNALKEELFFPGFGAFYLKRATMVNFMSFKI